MCLKSLIPDTWFCIPWANPRGDPGYCRRNDYPPLRSHIQFIHSEPLRRRCHVCDVWVWCSVDTKIAWSITTNPLSCTNMRCTVFASTWTASIRNTLSTYVGRMSIIYEDLWGPLWTLSTQTMSHGHNKHWDITLIPAIRERPGQTSDDLQIQSSGPVQGLARANISQDTRGCCAASMTQAMRNWGRVKMLGDRMTRTQCDPLYGVPGHTRSCVSYQHSTVTWCCDTGCQYIITPQSEVWGWW